MNEDKKIFNLTQHVASQEQKEEGVIEPENDNKTVIKALLTFDTKPSEYELQQTAKEIISIVPKECDSVMIGGAPYFLPYLSKEAAKKGFEVLHSFTERVSVEKTNADGTVEKTSVFQHKGFVKDSVQPSEEAVLNRMKEYVEEQNQSLNRSDDDLGI